MSKFLAKKGFKYKKTKNSFYREKNGFIYEIHLYRYDYKFIYDSKNDEVFITFHFTNLIKLNEFTEWYKKEIDPTDEREVEYTIQTDYLFIQLNHDQYDKNDFSIYQHYPVTFIEDAKFRLLSGLESRDKQKEFEDYFLTILPLRAKFLDNEINLKEIRKNANLLPNRELYVAVYYNQIDYAKELFDKRYDFTINNLKKAISENDDKNKTDLIRALNDFIKFSENAINHKYENPY